MNERHVFSTTADLYDLIYAAFKDYRAEAAKLATLVRMRHPTAATMLDVGCGSGEHARYLATGHGFQVDGIDIEPRFVELAQAKNPAGVFRCVDMVEFQLDKVYDAVVCLFGSIGYVLDVQRLQRAVAAMTRHLAPAGVLVLEPWFEPDAMESGYVTCVTAEADGVKVCRMSHTEVDGRVSRLQFEYLIGTREGLRRENEVHELGLFTREEVEAAIRSAGLTVEFDPEGLIGRGLYVARRAA